MSKLKLPWRAAGIDIERLPGGKVRAMPGMFLHVSHQDAERIDRAAACHDELVAALTKCEEIVSSQAGTGQFGAGLSEVARCELSSQLRAAVSKAKGGAT